MLRANDMLEGDVPTLDAGTVGRLKLLMEDVSQEGEDLAADLLATYRRDVDLRLERLGASLAAGQLEPAAEAVHALKGASATVGARRVSELSGRAEDELRAGVVPADLGEVLRREAELALAELERTLQGRVHD